MPFPINVQEKKLLDRFIRIVEEETKLYGRMSTLLDWENQAVSGADRPMLCRIIMEKERLISLIQSMEEQRQEMLTRLAGMAGGSRSRMTLTRLAELVDEPHAARIEAAGRRLSQLIRSIQEAGQRNKGLIEHHLHLVQGAIDLFEKNRKPPHVYRRTGELRPLRQTGKVFSGKI